MRPLIGMLMASCLLAASLLGAAGCGSAPAGDPATSATEKQALLEVGELYRLCMASTKKPPAKPEDLRGGQTVGPVGYQAVRDGSIVVVYSVPLNDTSEEGSTDSADEILAYTKDTPEKGGQVLMKNRTIKTVTAEQFKAIPQARK